MKPEEWLEAGREFHFESEGVDEAERIIRSLISQVKDVRKQAFLGAAEHLMKPQPSTTTFCCLSTLSKASSELRRKAEQEIGNDDIAE